VQDEMTARRLRANSSMGGSAADGRKTANTVHGHKDDDEDATLSKTPSAGVGRAGQCKELTSLPLGASFNINYNHQQLFGSQQQPQSASPLYSFNINAPRSLANSNSKLPDFPKPNVRHVTRSGRWRAPALAAVSPQDRRVARRHSGYQFSMKSLGLNHRPFRNLLAFLPHSRWCFFSTSILVSWRVMSACLPLGASRLFLLPLSCDCKRKSP
jgi:hypothetical protein